MNILENASDDRLISTDVISLMVWNCVDIKAEKLEDTIREIYSHDFVDIDMMGDADNVISDIKSESYSSVTRPLFTILERYDRYNNYLEGEVNEAIFFDGLMERSEALEKRWPDSKPEPNQPIEALEEPGRNDPCPCGSGRKYKHCCID